MQLQFFIPGEPIGKGRPRVTSFKGHARAYTPPKTAKWEAFAAAVIALAYKGTPLRVPVRLQVVALFSRPKRLIWKRREMVRAPHVGRPDADNVLKILCDSLEKGGVVHNDSVVWEASIRKEYCAGDESPGVHVTLRFGQPDASAS